MEVANPVCMRYGAFAVGRRLGLAALAMRYGVGVPATPDVPGASNALSDPDTYPPMGPELVSIESMPVIAVVGRALHYNHMCTPLSLKLP
jgi:hypothetical protein